MKNNTTTRKLHIRRETLRDLNARDLRGAYGGYRRTIIVNTFTDSNCTDDCTVTVWTPCTTSGSNCGTC